jgi:L-lactate dehydrogenase complex protein LldG
LPETHIAVVQGDDIVASYEDVFDRIRSAYGAGRMPRTLNMITGPSRTADIEQRLELGAHGPKRLHIIILDIPEPQPTGGHS